jgi:hypothetical protein
LAGGAPPPARPHRIDALLGRYSYDAATPIGPGTWTGAYWGAQTALAAAHAVLGGERNAFALCRPPATIAAPIIWAAIATSTTPPSRRRPRRTPASGWRSSTWTITTATARKTSSTPCGDTLFVLDPRRSGDRLPLLLGPCGRDGEGEGEGATLNLPAAAGNRARPISPRTLGTALERIAASGADFLICSYGADTFVGDPGLAFRAGERAIIR